MGNERELGHLNEGFSFFMIFVGQLFQVTGARDRTADPWITTPRGTPETYCLVKKTLFRL